MILQLNNSNNNQRKAQDIHSTNVSQYFSCIATDMLLLSMSVMRTHEIFPIQQAPNAHSRFACTSHDHVVTPTHTIFPFQKVPNSTKEVFTSVAWAANPSCLKLWKLAGVFITDMKTFCLLEKREAY